MFFPAEEETFELFIIILLLLLLHPGYLLVMNAPGRDKNKWDSLYLCALHFITGYGNGINPCSHQFVAAKWPHWIQSCKLKQKKSNANTN